MRLRGGGKIPTLGPNPGQPGSPYWADGINIHRSSSNKKRGSDNCITIKYSQAPKVWDILQEEETGSVWLKRE